MTDAVDTFRRIVLLVAKWLLFIVLGLAVLGGLIALVVYIYGYWTYDRHVANVKISVITTVCTDDKWPLLVSIENKSDKVLESTSFVLEARRKGRSSNIASYERYNDDGIRQPRSDALGQCWAAPLPTTITDKPRELEWVATSPYFTFKN